MASSPVDLKKQILDFSRDDEQDNKRCVDCNAPHPQWASANNAVFLCIQCAGVHRSFGVHISFVRSVTMDSWKLEEVAKMKLGGNKAFRTFLRDYTPQSEGGYTEGMGAFELYHSWAATQWRTKLSAAMANKSWSPSPPPATFTSAQPASTSSAPSLRKSRVGQARQSSTGRTGSPSPSPSNVGGAPTSPSPSSTPYRDTDSPQLDSKSANEAFFATLGASNALRPADIPPSQGGRYTGFGSSPPMSRSSPDAESLALSSKALPSLNEFSENPYSAFSKGWGVFSTAVVGAGKVVAENVRAQAPGVQEKMGTLVGEASKKFGEVGGVVREKTGVDVGESWGSLVEKVKALNIPDLGPSRPDRSRYSSVDNGGVEGHDDEETSALYRDEEDGRDDEDFFNQFDKSTQPKSKEVSPAIPQPEHKDVEKEGWDDWKGF